MGSFKMDASKFKKTLVNAVNSLGEKKRINRDIGQKLVASTKARFDECVSPGGEKWKTSERVKKAGGKTMIDSGKLKNSIRYKATRKSVKVYPKAVNYAGYAQAERPFIGISSEDKDMIKDAVSEHVKDSFK